MAVAKSEWGYKRVCQGCGCKFYDMKREPIVCPSCNTEIDLEALLKSRRPRSAPAKAAKPAKPAKVEPKPKPVAAAAVAAAGANDGDDNDADEDELAATVKDTVLPDDEVLALANDDDDLDADNDEISDVVVAKDDDET